MADTHREAPTTLRKPLVGEAAKKRFLTFFQDCYYPASQLTVVGELGAGTYAKVFHCTLDDDGFKKSVAVKKMDPTLFKEEQDVLDFFRETKLLASARSAGNANILAFVGVTFGAMEEGTEKSMCLIEEYINDGTLKSHIERTLKREKELSPKNFLDLLLQVARGLSFLHVSSVTVIHRDIKPANILIEKDKQTGELTAKLADFGLSVLVFQRSSQPTRPQEQAVAETTMERRGTLVRSLSVLTEFGEAFVASRRPSRIPKRISGPLKRIPSGLHEFYTLTGQTGSLAYMSPEVYRNEDYNHKADVFSFGILMFEALNLVHPYIHYLMDTKQYTRLKSGGSDLDGMEIYAKAVAEGYRPVLTKKWPEALAQVISDCWAAKPQERPSMEEVASRLKAIYEDCPTDDVFIVPKWSFCGACFGRA